MHPSSSGRPALGPAAAVVSDPADENAEPAHLSTPRTHRAKQLTAGISTTSSSSPLLMPAAAPRTVFGPTTTTQSLVPTPSMHDLRKLQDEICDLKAQLAAEQERATTTESELRDRNHELTTALAESIDIRETLYKAIAEERTDNADLHDLVRDILDENDRLRAILADRGLDTDALLAQYAAPLVAPPLVDDIADSAPGQQVPPTP